MSDLNELATRLRGFARAREWEQFHTPRNLALALVGEVGELAAELQWRRDDELLAGMDEELRRRLADEVADVLIYLLRFADVCGIDPLQAATAKVTRNEERYPIEWSKGSAAKYTERSRDVGSPHQR
jgi:NTP pyrophosphatase (non-canonical NTP hydrolase)